MTKDVDNFSLFFDTMHFPRFIISIEEGQPAYVSHVNQMAIKYFNVPRAGIEGLSVFDFMESEMARHFDQSFQVCLSRKRTVTVQALKVLNDGLRQEQFSFWVSPVMDADEAVVCLDVIGQIDMRNDKMLQRERDDAVSFLASIFDVSEVGIIITDELGHIIRVNNSFLRTYGWSRNDLVEQPFTDIVFEDERERIRVNHKKFFSVGMRSSGEVKILRKDGAVAHVLSTSAIMTLSHNRKFLITTFMDITLRKGMEQSMRVAMEQADSANRAKSNFLANMSHELRTPLNAIIGFSELMMKETFGVLGHDKYSEYVEDIQTSATHLLEIINEVLDMSKIEAGHLELDEDEFNMTELIASVCRMMGARVFSSDIEIQQTLEDDLPNIRADYRLIRQVLINLIMNAIKFSPDQSVIRIEAKLDRRAGMVISVKDQGIGIEPDQITKALEPFGQVDDRSDKRDPRHHGTGLGLPLAKNMVDVHGGEFNLESEVGVGTHVSFTIPRNRLVISLE